MTVVLTDKHTGRSTSFERRLTFLRKAFSVTVPEFFYDREQFINAPPGGLIGQELYFDFNILGIDDSSGKVDLEIRFEVLDAKSGEVVMKPVGD